MSIVRQGTLPVGSLDHAITLNVQGSGESHFETVTDTTPYLHRASPQDVASSMKLQKIVGGTIAWNQFVQNGNFASDTLWVNETGTTHTISNGVLTLTTETANNGVQQNGFACVSGHKYLVYAEGKCEETKKVAVGSGSNYGVIVEKDVGSAWTVISKVVACVASSNNTPIYIFGRNTTLTNAQIRNFNIFDLTQMFGSTIANYIYSLEQAHAGDGVAWFKALFPNDYYAYNSGELMSVKTSARKTYNADNVEIGSYALDGDLELRGIPKLDSNNELYYDGDTYASDGTVTRKYGTVTFNGSETWSWDNNNALAYTIVTNGIIITAQTQHNVYVANDNAGLMNESWAGRSLEDGTMGMYYGQTRIFVKKSTITSGNDAKTFFTNNPTNVIYALATPTTESADAYTLSQRVGATEEFVDGRTVEIPVGNVSEYKRLIQGGTP